MICINIFFYSKSETHLLFNKNYYERIINKWKNWFIVNSNINNYIWREIYNQDNMNYTKQYKGEEDMKILRSNILHKLKQ